MRILLLSAIVLPTVLIAVPASAITRDQAVKECRLQHSSYTRREADRTGVSRQQKVQACVRAKMRAK
jgi:hypothetical protein